MSTKAGATPSTYSPSTQKKKRQKPTFNDSNGVRSDGRGFYQCRPAYLKTGAVNAGGGSAYAEFGNTKIYPEKFETRTVATRPTTFQRPSNVTAYEFGPRESKKAMMYSNVGRLNCSVSYTPFATQIRGQGSEHKEFSSVLHKALEGAILLESFPKTTVDVFALVMESGGSDLPVIISCASLALADAGIMMYDMVASVSLSSLGPNLIIDPLLEEERCQDGSLMFTYMPSRSEVTQLAITGEWTTPKIHEGMELCLDASKKLADIMRSCLKEADSPSNE